MSNTNSDNNILQKNYFELTSQEHEALAQQAVRDAIARMHKRGIPTVEVDNNGQLHHRHPDGTLTPITINQEDETTEQ
jgi:crotonobetainyl-CoA:carnitine CoA-transferase CaiB-like acyl-CoA transferase